MFNIDELDSKVRIRASSISELVYCTIFILAIMMKCIYFQFICKINFGSFFENGNLKMYSASLGMLIIVMAIFFILFNKKRITALFVLDVCLTVLILADMLYFRYFSTALAVSAMFQLSLISSVGDIIKGLFKPSDFLMIVDFPLMIFGMIFIHKLGVNKIHILKRSIISVVSIIIAVAAIIIPLKTINAAYFYFDKNEYIKNMGIFYFHEQDVISFLSNNLFKDTKLTVTEEAKLKSYYENNKSDTSKYKGIATGKNVIYLQVEALQQFLINKKINGNEITPNLNKLIKDSLYFDNFYSQAGRGKTSDAELLANTSLYTLDDANVNNEYPINKFHTLSETLKNKGYSSYAFHSYIPSYYNRTTVYKSFGYDKFYGKNDYTIDKTIGWGLDDESFYRQTLDKLSASTTPYFGSLISLSSHYDFKAFENFSFDVGNLRQTLLGNYIQAQHYGDACIGSFIDGLKIRGLYDNTLLVIFGDHYGIPQGEDSVSLMNFLNVTSNNIEWTKTQRVPLIIHYKGLEKGVIDSTTGGQLDILPTVSNLLGVEAPYALGKDLLNTGKGYAVLPDSTVITDDYIFYSSTDTAFSIKDGKPFNTKLIDNEKYLKGLEISDIIIHKNAFKSLILD